MAIANANFVGVFKKKDKQKGEFTKNAQDEEEETVGMKIFQAISSDQDLSLEDGRVTKAYFDRLRMVEFGTFVMSLIGIGVSILQYEIEFQDPDPQREKWSLYLLWIVFISSILLVIMTGIRYVLRLEFKKKRNVMPNKATLYSTGEVKYMIAECILVFIHPSPFLYQIKFDAITLYDYSDIFYYVNDILNMILFLRIFIILRVVLLNTYWYTNRAQRLCEMYDCESGYIFTIKCMMKESPARFVFVGLFISIPIFGYWIRVAERPIIRTVDRKEELSFDFDSYFNSMWNVIITISTVGYGDYFVKTLIGRIVIFFCSIWGSFIVSLMVVAMTNILEMSFLEQKAYHVLKRLRARDKMRKQAAHILTRLVRVKQGARKFNYIPTSKIDEIKSHIKDFKSEARVYRELGNSDTGFEEMIRQFDFMRDQVGDIIKNTKYLMETNKLLMSVLGIDKGVVEKLNNSNLQSTTNVGNGSEMKTGPTKSFVSFMKVDEYNQDGDEDKQVPYKSTK